MNKDQAYHQIALACLKALRTPAGASAEDPVKELYSVIDNAFESQFALLVAELEDSKHRLNQIQQLDPQRHTLADAQATDSYLNTFGQAFLLLFWGGLVVTWTFVIGRRRGGRGGGIVATEKTTDEKPSETVMQLLMRAGRRQLEC